MYEESLKELKKHKDRIDSRHLYIGERSTGYNPNLHGLTFTTCSSNLTPTEFGTTYLSAESVLNT